MQIFMQVVSLTILTNGLEIGTVTTQKVKGRPGQGLDFFGKLAFFLRKMKGCEIFLNKPIRIALSSPKVAVASRSQRNFQEKTFKLLATLFMGCASRMRSGNVFAFNKRFQCPIKRFCKRDHAICFRFASRV